MLLTESVGKGLLAEKAVRVPHGRVVSDLAQFRAAFLPLRGPVVLKAQIESGGRGKSGGIKFAATSDEAQSAFSGLLGATINGFKVQSILVEEKLEIAHERYVGLLIDTGQVWLLIGRDGGIDVEEISVSRPDSIVRVAINPISGPDEIEIKSACEHLGIQHSAHYIALINGLFKVFVERDAITAEINPVAELSDGTLVALDARIVIDESAMYRQPDLKPTQSPIARDADRQIVISGLRILSNAGSIGYAGIGGGMGLTIMDWCERSGEQVAALMDIDDMLASGNTANGIKQLFDYFDDASTIRAVLLNITTCGYDLGEVAGQVLDGLRRRESRAPKPIIFHLHGNGQQKAEDLLREHGGLHNCSSLSEAIALVVEASRGVTFK